MPAFFRHRRADSAWVRSSKRASRMRFIRIATPCLYDAGIIVWFLSGSCFDFDHRGWVSFRGGVGVASCHLDIGFGLRMEMSVRNGIRFVRLSPQNPTCTSALSPSFTLLAPANAPTPAPRNVTVTLCPGVPKPRASHHFINPLIQQSINPSMSNTLLTTPLPLPPIGANLREGFPRIPAQLRRPSATSFFKLGADCNSVAHQLTRAQRSADY